MRIVIVGGGVAGVSCARCLRQYSPNDVITLITAGKHVKTVHNWNRVGQFTELFDVREEGLDFASEGITVVNTVVEGWKWKEKVLQLADGSQLPYDKLVIATGASPRNPYKNPRVLTIRDTDTARILCERLAGAQKVVIVGNGGIATELVFELRNIDITWCIRDTHISAAYFDRSTAEFLLERVQTGREEGGKNEGPVRRTKYGEAGVRVFDDSLQSPSTSTSTGCALGPDWSTAVKLVGGAKGHNVSVVPNVDVTDIDCSDPSKVTVSLSNGSTVDADLVIWATGVHPNTDMWKRDCEELQLAPDGGILVDEQMRSSVEDVHACGDVCTVAWPTNEMWTQMRTWTQARQMGDYAARCVLGKAEVMDFCFEMFAHCTTFYGYKIVLLGDFKGANQPEGWYVIERIVDSDHVVRCVMSSNRIKGAVLIGETDLEETIENLILNQTDMTDIEEHFLDPAIDIEDYFD